MLAGLWWGFIHGAHDYFEELAGLQGIRFGARQYHNGAGGTSSGLRMKFPLFFSCFLVLLFLSLHCSLLHPCLCPFFPPSLASARKFWGSLNEQAGERI